MFNLLKNFPEQWSLGNSTNVLFGPGCLDKLGDICGSYGKSAFIVTGESSKKNGLAQRCVEILESKKIKTGIYHDVSADPTVHQVNKIVQAVLKGHFNLIVALGGGSVIDAAKAASVIVCQGGRAEEYLIGTKAVDSSSLPVIAIPTTAGTGAELSKGAIISWPEKQMKGGIRGDALFADQAIVDPELTLTLPIEQLRLTGFDIFTHAVETYISRQAKPLTAIYSREAIKAVTHYLPLALQNQQNMEARTQLSFHSMLMGYNLANSSTCLPHRLQYPLGAMTNTAHALGLAALYPAWILTTFNASKEKFNDVSGWIMEGLSLDNKSSDIFTNLSKFMEKIHLSPTLQELGCDNEVCRELASQVRGNMANDPWWYDGANILQIYKKSL